MKTFVLKAGAKIRAEDLVLVDDEPGTRAAPVTALKHPQDTKQGKLDLQQKAPKPWANAHPRLKQTFNLRMADELHLKLKHCADIVPGAKSMQRLAMRAIEEKIDEWLKQYDKD